ncbi:BapA/Bap/LapF family large adhesin [Sphingomonas sp. Leaf257]|uniref:BapA/Bap/LapF family large adhesin n=1 Tax=Sphingomonas sp. Leaf257 TaxID=1736309 RepID=UPI000A75FB3A|nr:BapA/Bap/LapF family large adhesin [Sphingomonas sp. Leaf257]
MQTEIIAKATGTTTTTSANVIELSAPSVVRLNIDRSQVATMEREGNDLIIRLTDGQTIRIDHFYDQQEGKISDLVLRDDQGSQWLTNPSASGAGRFRAITDLDDLIGAAATGEGGGSSFILPAILGVAGVGGLVAAVSGGGGNGGNQPGGPTVDTQPPAIPTASFTANGSSVRGTGEAGATVRVTDGAGNVIGTGTVGADGTFTIPVNPPQTNGQPVTVVQSDAAGNVSPPATTAAPDITPPATPTATITGDGRTVSGTGEPGATVTVRNAAGQVLGTAVVGAQGAYTLTLTTPQANGGTLTVSQADPAGNVSPATTLTAPDTIPPALPTASINGDGTSISGTGEAGATVTVRNAAGQVLGTAIVDAQGGYTLPLTTPQANGGTLTVTQSDPAGNVSPAVTLAAPDITPPAAPAATLSADGTTVTGSGEPGATVRVIGPDGQQIGTAIVAADGSYTVTLTTAQTGGGVLVVTQTDAAGNVSPTTQIDAVDTGTMPLPTAQIDAQGTTVSGTGEPGATVIVRDVTGQTIGQGTVDANGNYSLTLATPQGNGETLTVVQSDTLGNVSPTITLTAPDFTAPAAPTATIAEDGSAITGTGEPGATVTVRDPAGQPLGTTTVDAQGNYTLPLGTPQTNGGTLTVTQSDPAGNTSPAASVSAPDTTAPAAPSATVAGDGASITGTGEPGATVAVSDAAGQPLGTATVDAQGNYTLPLGTPQANGETLTVTQSDPAGNISPATTVTAPDITAPAAPTATIAGDGTSITGTGEPGATVTVSDAAGQPLGTVTVDAQGNYTLPLTTPQANGETLTVTQSDPAGNTSPATSVSAPDITVPAAPTATVAGDGVSITGTGEPGATVTVSDAAGQPLGSATVDAQGNYSLPLGTPQANGETLTVTQSDPAGNTSPATTVTAPDITAPAAPTATIAGDGTSITGTGEPGATVTVSDAVGQPLGTVTVDAQGNYTLPLTTPQANGETLTVTQSDPAGNISSATSVSAPDITAPAAPVVTVSADGTQLTGTGEPGATVQVVDAGGQPVGTATVGSDGSFSLPLPIGVANGQTLSAIQTDAVGNASPATTTVTPDLAAPATPVATVSADGTSISGTGEPGATLIVRAPDNSVLATVTVAADGSFSAPLATQQANGETLSVTQADAAGNVSPVATVTAPDITPPAPPVAILSADGSAVYGNGEPGATVRVVDGNGTLLGSAVVAADSSYTLPLTPPQTSGQTLSAAQTDPAGNPSQPATVAAPDLTAPPAPIATIAADGTSVTGTGEPFATVRVRAADGLVIATVTVGADGSFTTPLSPPQANGEALSLDQTDRGGNLSPTTPLTAPDITAPTGLTATISGDGAIVTGSGEAGATVTIRDANGAVLGTATVAANGIYNATLTTPQINGETLQVTQADAAGNVSAPASVLAPDTTPPLAPTGSVVDAGATLSGTGEPGATVIIRAADGTLLGSGLVAPDGSFAVTLNPAQANGQALQLVQTDAAGNASPIVAVTAPDITAPTGLTATISGDGSFVTGVGEVGATVTVRDPDGTVIGTAVVGTNGSYAAPLIPAQIDGETLQVTQADAAGNVSLPLAPVAPDLTAPLAPVGTISADGTLVTGTGEAGATVTVRDAAGQPLGTATVAADGSFSVPLASAQLNGQILSVVQADAAGNVSPPLALTALDTTAPIGLTASVDATGIIVSGQAEAGATITVRAPDGTIIGTGTAGAGGAYALTLTTPQLNGQVLQVTQGDAAGNTSPPSPATAPDLTAPLAPLGTVSADGTLVTGTGEAGTTVTVRDAAGQVLGTAQVAADGSFSVPLASAQLNGQILSVVQADAAGNVSPPLALTALDTTAPIGLTASVDATGIIVSGQAEAGATITVRAPDGTIIGTGTAAATGDYALTLTTPQLNGQVLQVTQADPAGNTSPPSPATAPDLTAPLGPVFALDGTGANATGSGEVGATVTLRDASGTVIGTGQVGADGSFNVPLNPAQADGGTVSATLTDAAGNVSIPAIVAAPDITPPAAPVATLDATGSIVTGQGEVGATVTVRDAGGAVLGTGIVGPQGAYTVILSAPQLDSQILRVTQADATGNGSLATTVTALDRTAPDAPVATVSADGTVVSGSGEIGATVTITDPVGLVLATVPVNPDGSFSVTLTTALTNGQLLTLTQADAAGNVSAAGTATAPDLILNDTPGAPTAIIALDGASVSGTGQVGSAIIVRDANGAVIGNAQVAGDGTYTATLTTPQRDGETVRVTQTDAEGDVSPPATVIAPDLTAPDAPTAMIDPTGSLVMGTGEVGATVRVLDANGATLGTAIVGANGAYVAALVTPQVDGQPLTVVQNDAAGNGSPAFPVIAPDLTAPLAPIGVVSGDGTSLTGTGEVGATVTIRGAGGAVLGTAIVDANGNFTAPLTPAQANGQLVTLIQADAAGNVSPIAQATAPDITAPIGLTAAINGAGNLVTGTGEAGGTVTIRDAGGTVLGTAVVAANGTYAAILTPAQLNAQVLQVTEADAAGNVSTPATVIAPDLTAPLAPIGTVSGDGTTLTGTGEVGATVTIRSLSGTVLGTTVVDASGNFAAPLTPAQANGQIVTLTQADAAGNVSPLAQAIAPDITAPIGLTAAINGAGNLVTGAGEAGATVTIRDAGGTVLGTAVVAANGTYAAILTPAQLNAQVLQVTQADATGNASIPATVIAPDLTAPLAPIGTVSGDGTSLTGTGEVGATVTIRGVGGAVIGTAIVDANGNFTAPLTPAQANGQIVTLTQADAAGNISPLGQAAAPDITAPVGLTAVINGTGSVMTGTGEAGATVTIRDPGGTVLGTTIVASNGSYAATLTPAQLNAQLLQVSQSDAAGNVSTPATVIAPDLTAPLAPIGTVSGNGTTLTGTGEAGATVTIRGLGGVVIGTALVDANGNFTATLNPAQANGQVVTLTQVDAAGNVSPLAQASTPDITAPVGLTAAINGVGTLVTGQGEAGATVTVRDAGGNPIGTTIVAANGSYTVTLTTAQANGQTLTVTQADAAGNTSLPSPLIAPDITPPALPIATINGTGTIVTGSGEPGATVRILGAQGQLVGSAIVDANGAYTATLIIPQANGQPLTVTQADAAGNVSPQAPLAAPDITPPAPPTAAINATGTIVTGTGEAGTTVEVRNAGGTVIGTGTVAGGGTYAVTLATPQLAGETLNIGLRDGTGNVSGTVTVIAPFDISAFDNVAAAQVDLVPVQTNETLGNANYTALVSLGLVNLNAQVLAIPNVQFTVQQGHTLDATFTYDATLSLGVASGYSVVLQRFNGTSWVAVNGGGSSSLLEVSLLGGNLVATADDLAPGQYRAFVTFDNTAGVGLLGGLSVTGVDSDFTDVGQIVPLVTNGNVITDPGPLGQVDAVSPQTRVESVTLNGVTTVVTGNTQVVGQWGTLIMGSDGRYSYTPNADAAVLGKTDRFTYTLFDASDGERESATLTISIGSPDITGAPVAVNDVATAAATFVNVVETRTPTVDSSFATPTAAVLTGSRTGQITDSFTVDANSRGNITLSAVIAPGLSVVPSFTITVTNAAGTVVGSQTGTALAGVGGLIGSGISVTMNNLPSGTYNYTVTSTNTVGLGYTTDVYVGGTITHLDQFTLSGTTPTSGNLLANDTLGSDFLGIKMLVGGTFVDIGDAGRTLTGTYGTLTISEIGQYTYRPFANLGYAATDPIDRFTYQIVQPDGQVSTARLDVAIDINNGVAPVFPTTLTAFALEDPVQLHSDVVPMTLAVGHDAAPLSLDQADAKIALSLMEDQGSVEDVLSRYLDAQSPAAEPLPSESLADTGDFAVMPSASDISAQDPVTHDPLGYLTVSVDPEQERLATLHLA